MALPQTDSPPPFKFVAWYEDWKTSAAVGIFSGMTLQAADALSKRKQLGFAGLARLFIVGGVRGGVSVFPFTSVLNYLNEKRGGVDVHNFAASGAVAAGSFSLMFAVPLYRPGIRHRILSAMALSVSVGVVCYPIGFVYLHFQKKLRVHFDDLFKLVMEAHDLRKQSKERDDLRRQIKEGESEQCDD